MIGRNMFLRYDLNKFDYNKCNYLLCCNIVCLFVGCCNKFVFFCNSWIFCFCFYCNVGWLIEMVVFLLF